MSIPRAFVFLALLLLAACLEVESMEIRVVADRANDRLDVLVVSRGLWSSARSDENVAKDLADLRKCRDVAALPLPGVGVMEFTNQEKDDDWTEFMHVLDVEPGAFFADEQKRLCIYQFVRIRSVRAFAETVERRARKGIADDDKRSAETRALIEQAFKGDFKLLTIDGAGFTVRMPLADDDHREDRTELWRSVAKEVAKDPEAGSERGFVQVMRDNDVAIVRRPGVTEYVIGTQGSDVCEYRLHGKPYQDNLAKALAAEEPPPPAVTQAAIEKEFAAFRQREARLPETWRTLRAQKGAPAKEPGK